jgi:predicted RNA-binding Zn ribbon-like protein
MSFIVDQRDIVKYYSAMSSWSATQRYGIQPAPGPLALVQDFLNTVAIASYGGDLLADAALAAAWAADAVRSWSAQRGDQAAAPALTESDLAKLRALRGALSGLIAGDPPGGSFSRSGTAAFAVSVTGEVRLEPTGRGWHWLASALWGEVLLSQRAGTWRRLKQCRNTDCGSTFYDRSKNSGGVWCDVKTCGNAINLRASRARRRAAAPA